MYVFVHLTQFRDFLAGQNGVPGMEVGNTPGLQVSTETMKSKVLEAMLEHQRTSVIAGLVIMGQAVYMSA